MGKMTLNSYFPMLILFNTTAIYFWQMDCTNVTQVTNLVEGAVDRIRCALMGKRMRGIFLLLLLFFNNFFLKHSN